MENSWNHWKNWRTVRMRDFSYKMQQMRAFSCKNQGREPGRPKKKMPKKKCQLNFAPENMSLFPHPKTPHGNHRGTQRIFQSLIGTYRKLHFSEPRCWVFILFLWQVGGWFASGCCGIGAADVSNSPPENWSGFSTKEWKQIRTSPAENSLPLKGLKRSLNHDESRQCHESWPKLRAIFWSAVRAIYQMDSPGKRLTKGKTYMGNLKSNLGTGHVLRDLEPVKFI